MTTNETVTIRHQIDSAVDLPHDIRSHVVDDRVLYIDALHPTYIVVSLDGAKVIDLLMKRNSLRDVILHLQKSCQYSLSDAIDLVKAVLVEVDAKDFYGSRKSAPHLERKKNNIQLHLTNCCNLSCRHCYMNAGKKLNYELMTHEWKSLLDEYSLLVENGSVCFTGGEPLTRADIWDIAKYSKEKGNNNILFSNGCLINSSDIVAKLEESIDRIQISLDGTTEEIHDSIRGKGSFAGSMGCL